MYPEEKKTNFLFAFNDCLDSQEVEDSGREFPLSQSALRNYEVTRYMPHREIVKPYFTKKMKSCVVCTDDV
jgi:hypothetical protein